MAVPASALLIGCGNDTEALIFSSIDECRSSGLVDATACQAAYDQAVEEHKKTAPRFTSLDDCEAEFGRGNCQDWLGQAASGNSSGSSWFIPAMAGFMASQMLNSAMGGRSFDIDIDIDGKKRKHKYHSKPLYKTIGSGAWTTASAERIGSGTGRIKVDEKATWSSNRSETFKRGGFGSKASARGSWGS